MRRMTASLCLASLLLATAGAGPAAPPAQSDTAAAGTRLAAESRERFVAALAAFRTGDWGVAAREFGDRAWAATPLADYAVLFQAQSQVRLGDVAGARGAAARLGVAVTESRLVPSAMLELATLLSSAGDEKAATALLARFVEGHGHHRDAPRARLLLGQGLLGEGRTSEASKAFKALWLLAPATPEAETAGEQLRVLADRGLTSPDIAPRERVERLERLLAAGLSERARNEAETLLTDGLAPDLEGRALKVMLEAARRAGRWDAALSTVNRALATLPEASRATWFLELAALQQRKGRDAAISTLDKVVRLYPKSSEAADALLWKARLLEAAGKLTEAQTLYAKLGAEYADGEPGGTAIWRLGWIAWFRGAYGEAASTWARLMTARGGQAHREAATYWIGRADDRRGERELASRRFAELHADAPKTYYGVLAARRASLPLAARSPGTVVALPEDPLEPLQADLRYTRVEALRAVGLDSFADEEMADLTHRAVGDPKRLYALSAAYAQESRFHLALRILRRHFFALARGGATAAPRLFWEMLYPLGWRSELMQAANRAAVDPFFVAAVVREESSFYPQARSRVGARGLMQLMPETARPMAQARRLAFRSGDVLDEPAVNLELGTTFLGTLLKEFGDARLATAAYNAGPTRVREWWAARRSDDLEVWVEQIPFDETRAFVKRVMLSWEEYRRVYGGSVTADAHEPDSPR